MYHNPLFITEPYNCLPQSVVLFFFTVELVIRFIANGTIKTLRQPWNAFDALVLVLSVLLVLYKIFLDYIIIRAPYPPVPPPPRSQSHSPPAPESLALLPADISAHQARAPAPRRPRGR
jgi:hypothetical protein